MLEIDTGIIPPDLDPLKAIDKPELVIGLVGPIGTDRGEIFAALEAALDAYGYTTRRIRVSNTLHELPGLGWLADLERDEFRRIKKHMRAGTLVREITGRADALACFSIAEIRKIRSELHSPVPDTSGPQYDPGTRVRPATAYVLDSLKHPQEIHTLRAVYGRAFIALSIHTPQDKRVRNLSQRLAEAQYDAQNTNKFDVEATKLIQIDEKEEGTALGQDVRSSFPRADFFLNASSTPTIHSDIKRFLALFFNHPFRTPTYDEFGMFFAEASSWRSSDLGRQVGASILSATGELLAVGFNEVPKPNGGYNWEGETPDYRDFQYGKDEGTRQKNLMVAEVLQRIASSNLVSSDKQAEVQKLISDVANGLGHPLTKNLKALSVIEFNRSVHAEMAAICDAASRGVSIRGAQLFVNTFPCHICARHILAAGISRVVYIEPYPKSLTTTLYADQIGQSSSGDCRDTVPFEAFRGVAPRMYQFLFKAQGERKESSGVVTRWNERDANTKLKRYVLSYVAIEQTVVGRLLEKLAEDLNRNEVALVSLQHEEESDHGAK
ncbi:anti-phage dCTP deaminase [Thioalkalivibrio paradoxus]|uniref:anti-phage dCTP deaminase n=1 Tax=Thioalkalivibrio paradoxus TaxID=108010 RepID=UPI0018DBBB45|nr:anti-phage dCTP deaminase [Thioalkalivibrio paradoxus]